jgi:glycosyltransferase involved in cell wall biosynthesis
VRVTGPVDDILPYFRAADVAVNPMTEGSGVNLKLLEYLAAGLPTISTPFGMRGLEVGEVVQAADLADFPSALGALEDAGRRAQLGAAARRAAETRFGWEAVAEARERVYRELLERGTRARR